MHTSRFGTALDRASTQRAVRQADLVAVLDHELAPVVAAADAAIATAIWEPALVGVARELLARPGKQLRARLVELAYTLAGGEPGGLPPAIPQLIELVHAGSLIVDDIEDAADVRRGKPALHHICGVPLAINTGTWLYFAAYHLIEQAGRSRDITLEIYRRLTRTMFHSHQGQALDLAIDVTLLARPEIAPLAAAATALKAGELMSFAAELGALAAAAPAPVIATLARFGAALGIALQQLDDLAGLRPGPRRDKGREDLAGHRLTWPWAYLAETLDERLLHTLQLRLRTTDDARLDELADELTALLGTEAHRRACADLAAARASLATCFADHPALREVEAEIARLEAL